MHTDSVRSGQSERQAGRGKDITIKNLVLLQCSQHSLYFQDSIIRHCDAFDNRFDSITGNTHCGDHVTRKLL